MQNEAKSEAARENLLRARRGIFSVCAVHDGLRTDHAHKRITYRNADACGRRRCARAKPFMVIGREATAFTP